VIDDWRYKNERLGVKECGVSDGQAKGVNICKRRDAAGTVDEVVVKGRRGKGLRETAGEGDHPLGGAKYGEVLNASAPTPDHPLTQRCLLLRLLQNET